MMHVILAILGAVVTILVLLNRLQQSGINLGGLNPFAWQRRRQYRLDHDLNPAFKLTSPMEVAALYMVAVAKVDGEMSKEQKQVILGLFGREFRLSDKEASALLASSVHLFGKGEEVLTQPEQVILRSVDEFSEDQTESVSQLIETVAKVEGEPSAAQQKLISQIRGVLPTPQHDKW